MMKQLNGFQRGINLGGWLSQCTPKKEHYDTFITEQDLRTIASWGLDHVRLPIDYVLVEQEDGTPREEGYRYIETCIEWCRTYGLHMILDLHNTAGYSFAAPDSSVRFFADEGLRQRFRELWERLARRFSPYKETVLFELLNEVVDPRVYEDWNQLACETVETIRNIDRDVPVMFGGVGYNSVSAVPLLRRPKGDNIAYTFHCYEPILFTHQGAPFTNGMPESLRIDYPRPMEEYVEKTRQYLDPLTLQNLGDLAGWTGLCNPDFFSTYFRQAVEKAEADGVALYCGEYGVIDRTAPQSVVNWYRDIHTAFEKAGIGRAAWTYRQMDFGITDPHYDAVRDELLTLL